jgi:hypothetical protein
MVLGNLGFKDEELGRSGDKGSSSIVLFSPQMPVLVVDFVSSSIKTV